MHLILNNKNPTGTLSWWRPNSAGYTPDLQQAGRFTQETAKAICKNCHGTSIAIPETEVLALPAMHILESDQISDLINRHQS